MNNRDKQTLIRAAAIVKSLNGHDSQWLNEMEDGLTALANAADTIERIKKKQNRVTNTLTQSEHTHSWVRISGDVHAECEFCGAISED